MYFLKKTNHPFPTYWRQGISPAQILGLPSWIVTRNYVLAWTKAAPPASFAVTAAERWCYPARTLLPSPLTHTPRPSPQAPATSFSLICFQHTAFNERRPPSVPAAHASSTSAARPHRHAHTCPVSTPRLPPRERGNPKHRTSPLLLLFCNSVVFPIKYLQTHTHTSYAHSKVLPGGLTLPRICIVQWVLLSPAVGTSPESSAGVKSHLHSLRKPPKARAMPTDMQLSFTSGERRGGKETSRCQHWKFVCWCKSCITR